MVFHRKNKISFTLAALAAAAISSSSMGGVGTTALAAEPVTGGTLRVIMTTPVDTLDPAMGRLGNDVQALYPAFDRLVNLDASMNTRPGLAESWEVLNSGLALRLHLRKGVKFQDGTPFNADAVKVNLDRAINIKGSAVAQYLTNVTSVVVVDDSTVDLILDAPNSALPAVLADPAGMMLSPATIKEEGLAQIVGTGPYRITEYVPNESVTYTRNPDYWGTPAKPDKIVMTFVTDNQTAANAIVAGDADVLVPADPTTVALLQRAEGVTVDIQPGVQLANCYLRITDGRTLSNPDVRKALQIAVDRPAMNEVMNRGLGFATVLPVPKGSLAWSDIPIPQYDPEGAKALLAKAGYPGGLTLEAVGIAIPSIQTYMTVMQAQLAKAGITLNVDLTPGGTSSSQYAQGKGDMRCAQWSGRPDPYLTYAALFPSGTSVQPEWSEPPELKDLIQATASASVLADRQAAFAKLNDFVTKEAYSLPLLVLPNIVAYGPKATGFLPTIYKPDFSTMSLAK
jgi:ABC-type transport system substrate-binding protein